MAINSKIEWTENTWNPVTGCSKISEGCQHCYAERLAIRLQAMGNPKYNNGFHVTLHPESLEDPMKWKKPSMIFVNSMSDLFHKDVPYEYIHQVFDVMNAATQHTFQILTKRADRLQEIASSLQWSRNIWMGVSVENDKQKERIDSLRTVPASVRFISFEPLISPVGNMNLAEIHWAIVGGESGPMARPMQEDWVLEIKEQCSQQNVLFYFKQWGGTRKKTRGRVLMGKTWDDMPETINIDKQIRFA